MALHPCFQPAFPLLPTPLPYKSWRCEQDWKYKSHNQPGDGVAELSGGTGRQCRGAVWRHWGQCNGAVLHWGSSRGPDHWAHLHWWLIYNYSNRIQSFVRCSQPRQPSSPTPRNAPLGRWCSSTLNGSWRMGSPIMGRLTNIVVPVNSWFFPAHFGLTSQERSGATSASARDALWCHAFGKGKGIWCLVWSFVFVC